MLDFTLLAQSGRQSREIAGGFHRQAEILYRQGLDFFDRALSRNLDAGLLSQAGNAFLKGIEFNRHFIENYVALGYIFTISENFPNALKCLKAAQSLDPSHERTQSLIDYIIQMQSPTGRQKLLNRAQTIAAPSVCPSDDEDLDALFEHTAASLRAKLREALTAGLQPPPDLDPTRLVHKQQFRLMLQQFIAESGGQVRRLSDEFEVSELQHQLSLLERQLSQYEKYLAVCEQFLSLKQLIEAEILKTGQLEECLLSESAEFIRVRMDELLDRCDQIADRLDELDTQGHDIRPLEEPYNRLVAEIEKLEELCEDREA